MNLFSFSQFTWKSYSILQVLYSKYRRQCQLGVLQRTKLVLQPVLHINPWPGVKRSHWSGEQRLSLWWFGCNPHHKTQWSTVSVSSLGTTTRGQLYHAATDDVSCWNFNLFSCTDHSLVPLVCPRFFFIFFYHYLCYSMFFTWLLPSLCPADVASRGGLVLWPVHNVTELWARDSSGLGSGSWQYKPWSINNITIDPKSPQSFTSTESVHWNYMNYWVNVFPLG